MCVGRNVDVNFEEVQLQASLRMKNTCENMWKEDALAVSTKYTRTVLFGLADLLQTFQNSTLYKILFHTTQPAHFITAVSVLIVAGLLVQSDDSQNVSGLWTLIYLGSFSMHLGAQIWMTFISGLSLYFSIPRHTFGCVQKVLFPKYFLLNAVLSFITLCVFLRTHNNKFGNIQITSQVISMTLCFLIELLTRLYLTSPLLKLISGKNELEKDAGVGMEVGKFNPGRLLENEEYMKLHKSFRKLHMTIAIGNVISMGCTIWHLHYLSQKLSII
ncbi:transmembrane protein 205 [Harmonia axyridis]|uniref:transmembrane protein 205 n=1 Tax=Harmonia axyridis TaxID=115357 RepID=UPI001E2775D8|nr:transmembrane protein 205 [Harmonia axyridis]